MLILGQEVESNIRRDIDCNFHENSGSTKSKVKVIVKS